MSAPVILLEASSFLLSSFTVVSILVVVFSFLVSVTLLVVVSSLEVVSLSLDVVIFSVSASFSFTSCFSSASKSVEIYPVFPSTFTLLHVEFTFSKTVTSSFSFNFASTLALVDAFSLRLTVSYFIYAVFVFCSAFAVLSFSVFSVVSVLVVVTSSFFSFSFSSGKTLFCSTILSVLTHPKTFPTQTYVQSFALLY